MQLVVVMAVRKAVSAATITFTATSMTFFFMIHLLSIYDFRLLISNIRLPTSNIIHHPSSIIHLPSSIFHHPSYIIHLTSSIALVLPAFVRRNFAHQKTLRQRSMVVESKANAFPSISKSLLILFFLAMSIIW